MDLGAESEAIQAVRSNFMFGYLVSALLVALAPSRQDVYPRLPSQPEKHAAKLKTVFDSGKGLWMVQILDRLPPPEQLCQWRASGWVQITDIGQLSNNVVMTSPAGALNFARLRTCTFLGLPLTSSSIRDEMFEITPRDSIDETMTFGDENLRKEMRSWPAGKFGIVDKVWADKARVPKPKVRPAGGIWIIERT